MRLGISLDCRDGQHSPACQVCDCSCHRAANLVRAADALVRHQDSRIDGMGVTLAMMSVEGQAAAIEDARVCIEAAFTGSVKVDAQALVTELAGSGDAEVGIPWGVQKEDWRTFQHEHSASLSSHHGTRSKVRGAFERGWLLAWGRFDSRFAENRAALIQEGREQLAYEIWVAHAYDHEASVSMSTVLSMAGLEGLTLPGDPDQCADCHGFDGEHDPSCALDRCGFSGKHGNRCTCDAAYDRGVE